MQSHWDKDPLYHIEQFSKKKTDLSHKYILKGLGQYKSILECGIGSGYLPDLIRKYHLKTEYTGIDCTEAFVELVSNKHAYSIILGDMQKLPFEDNSFDIVYTRHTLEHLPYYDKAINEMARVAKQRVVVILFRPLTRLDIIREKDDVHENQYGEEGFLTQINAVFESHDRTILPTRNYTINPEEIFDCSVRSPRL